MSDLDTKTFQHDWGIFKAWRRVCLLSVSAPSLAAPGAGKGAESVNRARRGV